LNGFARQEAIAHKLNHGTEEKDSTAGYPKAYRVSGNAVCSLGNASFSLDRQNQAKLTYQSNVQQGM
jgi:hypothetical protein